MLILPQTGQNTLLAEKEIKSVIARDVPPALAITIVHEPGVWLYTGGVPSSWGQLPPERSASIAALALSNWLPKLGGTKRFVDILADGETPRQHTATPFELAPVILSALGDLGSGKTVIGLSSTTPAVGPSALRKLLGELKKEGRNNGQSLRIVLPGEGASELSAAAVIHNHMIDQGYEIVILPGDGGTVRLGITLAIFDPDRDALLDRGIPAADGKSGMLPPKLARMMVNIAVGNDPSSTTVVDPFCGNGRILLEAALAGYPSIGRDVETGKITASETNLKWLERTILKKPIQYRLERADATSPRPVSHTTTQSVIATETWLGPALHRAPTLKEAQKWHAQVSRVVTMAIENLAKEKPRQWVLAVPSWRLNDGQMLNLETEVLDAFRKTGYDAECIASYARSDSIVVRQIILAQPK